MLPDPPMEMGMRITNLNMNVNDDMNINNKWK